MNALPQVDLHRIIIERIRALQAASDRYIDASDATPLAQAWHALKQDIDVVMDTDPRTAWDLTGAWCAVAGDADGARTAFAQSAALGATDATRTHWLATWRDLGMFSAAHDVFAQIGALDASAVADGLSIGAIERTAALIEQGHAMGLARDEAAARDVLDARSILRAAGLTDAHVAQQLDAAGRVLRRHRLRPAIATRVTAVEGIFHGVTYLLKVPVEATRAADMNFEMVLEEIDTDIEPDHAFDARIESAYV
jgi:hypothetical protein